MKLPADTRGTVILISGERRAGKTTLLLRLRDAMRDTGRSVGGFLSVARFAGGVKTGIDLIDAATGVKLPLADYVDNPGGADGTIHTGHYVFNPAALEIGPRFAEAGQAADVFFVDELGPLELIRGEGWAAVLPVIAARRFGVALVVVRPELLNAARDKLGLDIGTPLVMVGPDTRDALAAELIGWLAAGR